MAIKGCFDETSVENREFPLLHRIVVGLEKAIELGGILQASTAGINDTDSKGRTALAWAAFLGDGQSAELLLAAGADPNFTDNRGHTPLHLAAEASNPSCLTPLLRCGAFVDAAARLKTTPLMLACESGQHGDDVEYLELLIRAGADVEIASAHMGRRALHQAVLCNRANMASYLIASSAKLEEADNGGHTPLLCAVLYNSHESLKFLLSQGADVTARTSRKRSILHLAALKGDVETMNVLSSDAAVMSRLDVNAVDADQRTARDLFDEHEAVDDEHFPQLKTAFITLLSTRRPSNDIVFDHSGGEDNSDDEDHVYYSATETA